MDKFCIFCGNKPESKNREHIIPQWLIKLTGDPNRIVYLGRKWTTPKLEERRYALNSYVFPACEDCNAEFSRLEAQAQSIVQLILARSALNAEQWDIFLDWLDKVRTGLWLGGIYLNGNYRGINPSFYIKRRIGSKDRFLIIYEIIDDNQQGIGWSATDTPLFEYMPSCFTLTINNFLFFNISRDFLFAERFGFPYPANRHIRAEGGEWLNMKEGTRVMQFPLLDSKFKTGGTQLFQPMIPLHHFFMASGEQDDASKFYDNEYIRDNCMNFDKGKGKIFRRDRNILVEYPAISSREWLPKQRFSRGEVTYQTSVMAGEMLEALYTDHAKLDQLEPEEAARIRTQIDGAVRVHRTILNHLKRQKNTYY